MSSSKEGHDGPRSLTYAKIGQESNSFSGITDAIKSFSCFSTHSHSVQWSNTILAILVESFKEHFYEIILRLGHWPISRCL